MNNAEKEARQREAEQSKLQADRELLAQIAREVMDKMRKEAQDKNK